MSPAARRRRPTVLWLALLWLAWEVPGTAQDAPEAETTPPPTLTIEAITVTPARPAAEALISLAVTLRNHDPARTATALGLRVTAGGVALRVYDAQRFMAALPPAAATELALYNLWTAETGRPAPKDGILRLEISLEDARWVSIETDDSGEEIWTVGEPVPGLPVTRTLAVTLAR